MAGTTPERAPGTMPDPRPKARLAGLLFAAGALVIAFQLQNLGWSFPAAAAVGIVVPVAAYALILLYVIIPIRTRRTFWMTPAPEVRPFDPEAPGTPGFIAEAARETAEALGPLGFVGRGHVFVDRPNPVADSFASLFEDRASRTVAKLFHVIAQGTVSPKVETALVFSTKFADGTEVITSNARKPPLMPIPRTRRGYAFPDVRDPARLVALHRRAVEHGGEFSARIEPATGDPAVSLLATLDEELAFQASRGHLRFDGPSGRYRLTPKGAFLMIWKQLWPWGPIRRAARRRRAARWLREWEGPGG